MSLINSGFRLFLLAIFLQSVVAYYSLFEKRQDCVTCPTNPPACPDCPEGQSCQITSQSCTQCAQSLCINSAVIGNVETSTPTNGPDTGAIAGGIVAAIVVVGCIVGGIFWFVKKKRQATRDMDLWLDKTSTSTEEKCESNQQNLAASANVASVRSSHHSITSTTMSNASNVIPIGYIPSPLRNTMMSTDTGYTTTSIQSPRSHPPTQFFSADDILRASLATNHRDTQYSDRYTVYSDRDTQYSQRDTRYSNRDSVGTSYTRASIATRASVATNAYRSTAIITAAPVAVPVVRAQPKIVTFGKQSAPSSPIPAVPALTAEKVAEAERARATANEEQIRQSNRGSGLNIPISIVPEMSRLSTISSISSVSVRSNATSTASIRPPVLSTIDVIPESPILGHIESLPPSPGMPSQGLAIVLTPPDTDSIHEDQQASQMKPQ